MQPILTGGRLAVSPPLGRLSFRAFYRARAKRWLDVALVILALPVVAPVILLCAGLVAADGGAPFFAHERVGRGGRRFRCWKLRSMHRDPARLLARHFAAHPHRRQEFARHRKLVDDPRVTPLGRLLRRSSLDELPQLLNVLRGEMSLVGPRPITAEELALYGPHRRRYLAVRPGITGLWQVSGRNALSLDQRMRLDAAYAARFCAALDLRILLRTGRVVLSGQ